MAMKAGAGHFAEHDRVSHLLADADGPTRTRSTTAPLSVTDTRTSSLGWNLQITSTQLTKAGGGATLPTGASTITGVASACNTGSACTTPTNSVTCPLGIPSGIGPPAAVKFYNASAGTGTGIVTVTPTVQVAVPANAAAGSYTNTLDLANQRAVTPAQGREQRPVRDARSRPPELASGDRQLMAGSAREAEPVWRGTSARP